VVDGVVRLTPVEFAALFDGIDWTRVSEDFAPVSPTLDDQLFSAVAHRHGMSSSMRRFGQPLTRRVRRSAK
jgi:hypothetical protein